MSRAARIITAFVVGCAMYLIEGCAAVTTPVELGWRQDMPNFKFQRLEWNLVAHPKGLKALCGLPSVWNGKACVIRLNEGGQCIAFSTLTEEQARREYIVHEGWSLWDHEVRGHCGYRDDGNHVGGWAH